jgi:hypothetical protein
VILTAFLVGLVSGAVATGIGLAVYVHNLGRREEF